GPRPARARQRPLLGLDRVALLLLGLLVLRGLDIELERVRVDEADVADRQVLAVPRVARDARELRGEAVVVDDLPLGAADGVDDVVELAGRGLPLVPEPL